MVKVEGSLEELAAIFGGSTPTVKATKKRKTVSKAVKGSTPRKKSGWQRYMGQKKNQVRFKSGAMKGRLNLKTMARNYRRGKR